MTERKFSFILTENIQDTNCKGDVSELYTSTELLEHLRTDWVTFIPETKKEFQSRDKNEKSDAKRKYIKCGLSGKLKTDSTQIVGSNIESRSFIILDCEDASSKNRTADIPKKVEDLGVDYILYPSISDTLNDRRFRVFLFTDRDISKEQEYEAVAKYYAFSIGADLVDECSFKWRQLMLLPTSFSDVDVAREIKYSLSNNYIDVDEVLTGANQIAKIKTKFNELPNPTEGSSISHIFCKHINIYEAIELVNKKLEKQRYKRVSPISNRFTYLDGSSAGGLVVFPYQDGNEYYVYCFHTSDKKAYTEVPLNAYDFCKRVLFTNDEGKEFKDAEARMEEFAKEFEEVRVDYEKNAYKFNVEGVELIDNSVPLDDLTQTSALYYVLDSLTNDEDYLFHKQSKKWLKWDGKNWTSTETSTVDRQVILPKLRYLQNNIAKPDERKKFRKVIEQMSTPNKMLSNLSILAEHLPYINSDYDYLEGKLICEDGVIDLKNKKLLQFDKNLRGLPILNVHFDEKPLDYNAFKQTEFYKMLYRISNYNQDWIDAFQRVLGCTLTGKTFKNFFVMFDEEGNTGKSTIINILSSILTKQLAYESKYAFVSDSNRNRSDEYYLSKLEGKRLLTVGELSSASKFNETTLKEYTGGDDIEARDVAKSASNIRPVGNIIMVGNEMSHFVALKKAFTSRMIIIPCYNPIKNVDKDFQNRVLANERDIIFKWLVDGAEKSLNEGIIELPDWKRMKQQQINDKDWTYKFIKEAIKDVNPDKYADEKYLQKKRVRSVFKSWAAENGIESLVNIDTHKFSKQFTDSIIAHKDDWGLSTLSKNDLWADSHGQSCFKNILWNEEVLNSLSVF